MGFLLNFRFLSTKSHDFHFSPSKGKKNKTKKTMNQFQYDRYWMKKIVIVFI